MLRQERVNIHPRPHLRPIWQLLLAEQTGQHPPLTHEECQALLEFLSDLVSEGLDPDIGLRWLDHCLDQMRTGELDILSCPLPISPLHLGTAARRQG